MLVLCICVLFTVSFGEFSDVPENHWGYGAINRMEKAGILSGYSDGTFRPSKNITLAEFASIFTKIFEIEEKPEENFFPDISKESWAKGKVEAVREYINPYYDSIGETLGITKYSYMDAITENLEMTREAFIYAIAKLYSFDETRYVIGEEKTIFADSEDILFPKEITLAYKNGVISGEVVEGTVYIRPKRHISRVEASSIFRNLLKYDEETRVRNKSEEYELKLKCEDIFDFVKKCEFNKIKESIFDTAGVLKNDNFVISDEKISELKNIVEKYVRDLKYEITDVGFDSFNRGYVKVKYNTYDIEEIVAETVYNMSKEENSVNLDSLLIEMGKDIKRKIDNKEITQIEKEETFKFAKQNGNWKLILGE